MGDIYLVGLLMAIFIVAYYFSTKQDRENKSLALESEILKRCPLHKWEFLEQPGFENTYYTKCAWCGKTPQELLESN